MDEIERQETAAFLRRMHIEEMKRHANFCEKLEGKPFKEGSMRVEYMDGTAEEFRINPDDDTNEIIKFVSALHISRVRKLLQLLKQYE
jgi:hypothetical protein